MKFAITKIAIKRHELRRYTSDSKKSKYLSGKSTSKQKKEHMAKENESKSRRDTFRENFASRHPDVNMEDEEAYYGALDDEYSSREAELRRYREDNDKLNNLFLENPNAAYFMNDLLDGKEQMGVSLMRQFGELFKDAFEDPTPENVKAFADALDEHAARVKENEKLQAQYEQNYATSRETIDKWVAERGLTPEQDDAVMDYLKRQFTNQLVGIITPEMLDFAYKGLNYDKDVTAAEEIGAAAGRNQRIDEKLRKGKGDGLPRIAGGGRAQVKPKDGFLRGAMQDDPWESAKREKY